MPMYLTYILQNLPEARGVGPSPLPPTRVL